LAATATENRLSFPAAQSATSFAVLTVATYESRLAGFSGAARALLLVAYTGWSKKQQLTLVL
jgi:hypothetical protein